MPQQLIYTSAPRGIVAGRSGYCTVARSATLREALMLQLEKFCYYQHLSLSGGQERPIYTCRTVDIRGSRFHVLSRIQDAGLDFTGRTNFIAHHLVFAPDELRTYPAPPVILRDWPGWRKAWNQDPQLLENEDWTQLAALAGRQTIPAQAWQQVTGDAVNGYGLLEARPGATFRVDDQSNETVLELFAESLSLLEIRDPRRDGRVTAWSHTFTTSMQEQDNPADFRWRCIHSDNPAASRFATPDFRPLSAVRAIKWTAEESAFARTGRQPPRFLQEPQDAKISEGERATFTVKTEGVPRPALQWYSVDRAGGATILTGETRPELVLSQPPFGITRYRVSATNWAGTVQSRVATLSVEERLKAAPAPPSGIPRPSQLAAYQRTDEEIERQRQRLEMEKAAADDQSVGRRNKILMAALAVVLIAIGSVVVLKKDKIQPAAKQPDAVLKDENTGNSLAVATPVSPVETPAPNPANAPDDPNKSDQVLSLPAAGPLPQSWQAENIGSASEVKAAQYSQGSFFLTAQTGELVAGATSDDILFTSQPITNSPERVEFIARLSPSAKDGGNCRGIMLRESNKADSPFVFAGCSAATVLWVQRTAAGVPAQISRAADDHLPLYFKLTRERSDFSGSFSRDGTNWWQPYWNVQINMSSNYFFGFAIYSGRSAETVHAQFDDVTINGEKQ